MRKNSTFLIIFILYLIAAACSTVVVSVAGEADYKIWFIVAAVLFVFSAFMNLYLFLRNRNDSGK